MYIFDTFFELNDKTLNDRLLKTYFYLFRNNIRISTTSVQNRECRSLYVNLESEYLVDIFEYS